MTRIERIDADHFLILSAMIRRIRVIRVLLNPSLLRTPMADPVYTIENPSRWGFNLMCGIGAAWRWPDRERGREFAPSLMVGLPPRSVG
jgi:hypothetical protein